MTEFTIALLCGLESKLLDAARTDGAQPTKPGLASRGCGKVRHGSAAILREHFHILDLKPCEVDLEGTEALAGGLILYSHNVILLQ
jgi:hypothetical protein